LPPLLFPLPAEGLLLGLLDGDVEGAGGDVEGTDGDVEGTDGDVEDMEEDVEGADAGEKNGEEDESLEATLHPSMLYWLMEELL
jgi:hypothetical protein